MTRNASSHRDDDDRVLVSPGVPTDRIRWGPILAGTFAALTALAVLSTLGTAIGLSAYDPGQDDPRNFARAGGIWGVLSLIVAFAFGGWLTARAAAVKGRHNGMLNGFMVAGFGIPLMLFMLGSLASSVGQSAAQVADDAQARHSQSDGAMTASAQIGGSNDANSSGSGGVGTNPTARMPNSEDARRAGSRAAWGTLFGLILAIGAASAAGAIGARDDRDHDENDDHSRGRHRSGDRATSTSTLA